MAFLAATALVAAGAYVQIAYAKANYPTSWRWRLALFAPPFLFGSLVGYVTSISAGKTALFNVIFSVGFGLAFGLLCALLYPLNMKRVIPKHKPKREL